MAEEFPCREFAVGDCLILIIPDSDPRPLLCSGPVAAPSGVRRGFFCALLFAMIDSRWTNLNMLLLGGFTRRTQPCTPRSCLPTRTCNILKPASSHNNLAPDSSGKLRLHSIANNRDRFWNPISAKAISSPIMAPRPAFRSRRKPIGDSCTRRIA